MPVRAFKDAIWDGFYKIMKEDPKVFLIGVGLSDPNAVFGTLKDFQKHFGKRVIEAPLCENMLTGLVHGAALAGMKPVLVHTRINFAFLGMDQIVNHIALWKKMFSLQKELPIMIRGVVGQEGWGNSFQHLGTYDTVFKAIQGLHVVVPETPLEAHQSILDWCFVDPRPTMYIDKKELYETIQDIP